MTENEQKVYDRLKQLNIQYESYAHQAVFSVADANDLYIDIPGKHCKNLFLSNKKGEHYLLVLDDSKKADLKKVATQIESPKLFFEKPEVLYYMLGLTPGSVSPFGLINNADKNVVVLLDNSVIECDRICFHPNVNTATVSLSMRDFMSFLRWCGNKLVFVEV